MPSAKALITPAFSAVPSALRTDSHELRNFYHGKPDPAPAPITAPHHLTPYLGLRARLSQVWINRWTVLLLLVLVRTLLAVRSLDDSLDSARREAFSACTSVESMGSAMASMPHYMSQGVNELTASGVEKAVNGLMSMLMLSVTGVEELVVFVVNLLTSTYVCLLTLVISGSMQVALDVAKDVTDFLNKTLGDIGNEIQDGVKEFQDGLNKFTSALNSVPKIFGSDSAIPTLNIDGSLQKLDNLELPSTVNEGLEKLNASIPTFSEVQEFTNGVLRLPFEEVKKKMNETMVANKFDRSVFPRPEKKELSFCSDDDGINDFFDKLIGMTDVARKAFIGIVLTLAVLVCIPMAWREVQRWRTMQKRARLLNDKAFDPLDVVQITSRPFSSTLGMKAASRFSSPRRQILVRWFFAYIASVPALFVLSLGFAGLFACLCQVILLKAVEKETPALAGQVGEFAGKVVTILNDASEQWAVGANGVMESKNNELNQEVFGWVNATTTAVNGTLNTFVDKMSDTLNVTFGGTILYEPIKEVLNCLIGIKIAGIQRGLDWVSENARVDFPRLPNNTFSLGAIASLDKDSKQSSESFLADPGSKATDKITDIVARLTDKIASGIRTEAIISTFLILVWVIIFLIGLGRVLVSFHGRDKPRAEGGAPPPVYTTPNPRDSFFPAFRGGPDSAGSDEVIAKDWAQGNHDAQEKVGFAGMRGGVAAVRMAPERSSSYGVLDEKR